MVKDSVSELSTNSYKARILKMLNDAPEGCLSGRQVAYKLGVRKRAESAFYQAFTELEGIMLDPDNDEEDLDDVDDRAARIRLARRVSTGEYVYYSSDREKELIETGLLSATLKNVSTGDTTLPFGNDIMEENRRIDAANKRNVVYVSPEQTQSSLRDQMSAEKLLRENPREFIQQLRIKRIGRK